MRHTTQFDATGWLTRYDDHAVLPLGLLPKFDINSDMKVVKPKRYVVNLKGCNGSGKSTIPMQVIANAPNSVHLVADVGDKKPCAIYVPSMRTAIVGLYSDGVNCGGCDALGDTQIVKKLLARMWKRDVHIMYEGVIVGDIKSTFYEIMLEFNKVHEREVSFCFMGTKLRECFGRIQSRNGGKSINEELVRQKYRNALVQLKYYLNQGDVGVTVLDTNGTKLDVYNKFLGLYPRLGK